MAAFSIFILLAGIALIAASTVRLSSEVAVVERLGRYSRTLRGGLHFIIPFVERVIRKPAGDQTLDLPATNNLSGGTLVYEVFDYQKAHYDLADLRQSLLLRTVSAIRDLSNENPGATELDLQRYAEKVKLLIKNDFTTWGVTLKELRLAAGSR